MDVASLAAALVAAQMGRMQLAMAAQMMKTDTGSHTPDLQMLQAGQQNLSQLSNAAAGLGQNLDISV